MPKHVQWVSSIPCKFEKHELQVDYTRNRSLCQQKMLKRAAHTECKSQGNPNGDLHRIGRHLPSAILTPPPPWRGGLGSGIDNGKGRGSPGYPGKGKGIGKAQGLNAPVQELKWNPTFKNSRAYISFFRSCFFVSLGLVFLANNSRSSKLCSR